MSRIARIVLATSAPNTPMMNPSPTVTSAGSTTSNPEFVGVIGPGPQSPTQILVVFRVRSCRLTKGVVLVGATGVEITIGNSQNDFFYVLLDQTNTQNWTIQVRTRHDPPTDATIFVAGTGSGV